MAQIERASVFETSRFGLEAPAAPGVLVPAAKLMQSMSLVVTPDLTIDMFRPAGNKYDTVAAPQKDLVSAKVTGKGTYSEIMYPMASLFGAPTNGAPNTDGMVTHTFNPAALGPDAFSTFTVEQGSVVAAQRFTYGLFTSLGLKFDRSTVDLTADMMGQALVVTGVTLTPTPTALTLIPILGRQMDVYVDPTSGTLGTTKLGRCLSGEWNFSSKYLPVWIVDSSQPSYVAIVEKAPTATFKMTVEADAAGMAFLTQARAGSTAYIRIKATGPAVGASAYGMQLDMAGKLGKPDAFSDVDGIYALAFTWTLVDDPLWLGGTALLATVTNMAATL